MTKLRICLSSWSGLLAASVFVLGLGACGDDDPKSETEFDAGVSADANLAFVCDPVGANPEMGALLNAPLDTGVQVIEKEGAHPGDPGPENLP